MHHDAVVTERRQQIRHARGLDVFFRPEEDVEATMCYARVTDVSPAGLGLVSEWPLRRAAVLRLLIMNRRGAPAFCVRAVVRHVRPKGKGRWAAGCQFVRELGETEWAALETT